MTDRTFLQQLAALPLEDEAEPVHLSGFVIECRRGEAFDPEWWIKAVEEGENVGRMPCLTFQVEEMPWYAMIYAKDVIPDLGGTNHTVTMLLDAFLLILARRSDPMERISGL